MKFAGKVLSMILVCTLMLSMCAVAITSAGAAVIDWVEPKRYEVSKGDIITYKVDITADEPFEDVQAKVIYNPHVLELITNKYDETTGEEYKVKTKTMFPALSGVICNTAAAGFVKFNATNFEKFDFTEGATLCEIEFIAKENAITDISLDILYMTIDANKGEAYFDDGVQTKEEGITIDKLAVKEEHEMNVTLSENTFEYNGKTKTPKVKVVYGELLLKEGTDYTVTYSDNIKVGTAKATVTYIGTFKGTAATVMPFTIYSKDEPVGDVLTVKKGEVVTYEVNLVADEPFEDIQAIINYDPDVLELITYKYDAGKGEEYKVSNKVMFPEMSGVICNTADVGFVKFNATDIDKFDFSNGGTLCTVQFIAKADAETNIDLNILYMTIDANLDKAYFEDGVQVKEDGIEIIKDTDKTDYTPVVTLSQTEYEYDGNAKTPGVKVVYGELLLKEGTDYTVKYSNNVNEGVAKATVTYKGKYSSCTADVKEFYIGAVTPPEATTFNVKQGEKVVYTVDITAEQPFENIQAVVKFDADVLELVGTKYNAQTDSEYTVTTRNRVPNLTGAILNDKDTGYVKFNASDIDRFDFTKGANLITLEFVAKCDTTTDVVIDIQEMNIDAELGLAYYSNSKPAITDGITVDKAAQVVPFEPVVTLEADRYLFDGYEKTPEVKVVFADMLLKEGEDYSVFYKNNIYAGTATAEVVFSGKYEGEVSADFTIVSGYVDPVTGIIIDDTFGYEVYCKVVEPDDEDLDADFNFVGESISKIYEVYLVDQSTGMRVTHKDVTVRIPCAKDDVFYHLIRNGEITTLATFDDAVYDNGYFVHTGKELGKFYLTEPTADYLLGDVNGDGVVNIKDVTVIQKNIALIKTAPMTGFEFADVNDDGNMNVRDVTAIQKYIANIDTGLPIGQPLK